MKHTTLLLSAVFAGAALSAPAIETRDSSQFTYKYEMDVRPDLQDLDGAGANDFTGWNDNFFTLGEGAMTIDASSNGKYLGSAAEVGSNGDIWRALGASSTDGFTVEARVKVTECTGANGAICIEAGPSDSKVYARLNLFGDKIKWNGTTLTNLDTSVWHTYRIAREGGKAVHAVWVDDVLVASNLGTGFTYDKSTLYRMLLGSPGGGWTGKAQVDYLRFTKGAYVPVPVPKASIDFPVKYEMDANDTRISASANASDWTINGQSGATIGMNGVLSVVPNGKQPYWRTTDSAWKNSVTADTAFTVEFAAKINSCTLGNGDRTLQFWAATPRATGSGILNIGMNHVYWQPTASMDANIELDSSDNSDHKHVFRITYDGASSTGFTVWRDGVKIGENLGGNQTWTGANFNMVRFGIPGTTVGGAFNIFYIRWDTTGAYDWKESVRPFTLVVR